MHFLFENTPRSRWKQRKPQTRIWRSGHETLLEAEYVKAADGSMPTAPQGHARSGDDPSRSHTGYDIAAVREA